MTDCMAPDTNEVVKAALKFLEEQMNDTTRFEITCLHLYPFSWPDVDLRKLEIELGYVQRSCESKLGHTLLHEQRIDFETRQHGLDAISHLSAVHELAKSINPQLI